VLDARDRGTPSLSDFIEQTSKIGQFSLQPEWGRPLARTPPFPQEPKGSPARLPVPVVPPGVESMAVTSTVRASEVDPLSPSAPE
jgi:hypothetical protein